MSGAPLPGCLGRPSPLAGIRMFNGHACSLCLGAANSHHGGKDHTQLLSKSFIDRVDLSVSGAITRGLRCSMPLRWRWCSKVVFRCRRTRGRCRREVLHRPRRQGGEELPARGRRSRPRIEAVEIEKVEGKANQMFAATDSEAGAMRIVPNEPDGGTGSTGRAPGGKSRWSGKEQVPVLAPLVSLQSDLTGGTASDSQTKMLRRVSADRSAGDLHFGNVGRTADPYRAVRPG